MTASMEEAMRQLREGGIGCNVEHKSTDYSNHTGQDRPSNRNGNRSRYRNQNGGRNGNRGNNRNTNNRGGKQIAHKFSNEAATAPYNFVSLPVHAMHSGLEEFVGNLSDSKQKDIEQGYKKYINSHETISGYIELELETLTPVFIRNEGGDPFKLGNVPVLPGSSLRGMIKNIFKMITMSTMRSGEDYIDRHVFFRRLMASKDTDYLWAHDLHDLYIGRMQSDEGSKVRPGFLIKVRDNYFIVPSKAHKETIYQYEQRKGCYGTVTKTKDSDVKWHGSSAYILTGKLGLGKKLYKTLEEYEAYKAGCRERGERPNPGKQLVRYIRLEETQWNERYPVDITEYMMDNNRGGVNLVDKKYMRKVSDLKVQVNIPKDITSLAPCYYVPGEGGITLFGHGQCFRIPYKHSIGEIVKKHLREDVVDYSDAVFGMSPYFASRVYFEDGKPHNSVKLMPEFQAHPLLQPNPTSFQLYLKNSVGQRLANWDSDNAEIRGYKLYWHQANGKGNYKASKEELSEDNKKSDDKKLCLPMKPVPANTKFTSRIRFKNLLPEELGALVMTLDMDNTEKNIAFKLGQGKSMGLGSIKLNKHDLFVETDESYTRFLDGTNMANACQKVDSSEYRAKFKEAVPKALKNDWKRIMDELTVMLDYDNTKLPEWHEKTAPMRGEYENKNGKLQFTIHKGFADRRALPTATQVIARARE
ncbi:MAG: TIGR03986 family CRISPR-associated RAMP protein [Anaerovibrio sp.]|uniref:TIGR03986 family type III CRISPR-associated RAMP protein n=1 Tax=Anaerovibrio sp. TaxID=1872532 RepID=UPI0025E0447B|nr:TIGR03986 family CRISPR-associated RAMP protein [Anaerovibrio sp.]MCR5176850.1 TIGR03986 family CRISPR-associated RAMP protein [Anaerovibrio sp.]